MIECPDHVRDDVKRDWTFADRSDAEVLAHLTSWMCERLWTSSTLHEDLSESTDYRLHPFPDGLMKGGKFASRMRRLSSTKDKRDLTLRCERKSGTSTEYQKLKRQPKVGYYLYGWIDDRHHLVNEWMIIDLNRFRDTLIDKPDGKKENLDRGSKFFYWTYETLRSSGCLVYGEKYPYGNRLVVLRPVIPKLDK